MPDNLPPGLTNADIEAQAADPYEGLCDAVREEHVPAITAALQDPQFYALAVTTGLLLPLEDGARRRVLAYVTDAVNDPTFQWGELADALDARE